MTLADEIRALRDRVLTDLNSAHDYYTETKVAWRIVHKVVETGNTFTIQNKATGTVTTQTGLAPGPYHREIWERIRKAISDIANAAIVKAS